MTPRVLQVVLSLDPGGTERLVLELVRRLHREIPMAVCCLDGPGAWAHVVEAEGVTVSALRRQPGFHPWLGRHVAAAARRHRATTVHAHHYSPFVYAAMARLMGGPSHLLFTEHGRLSDTGPSAKRRLANRALAGLASRTFTVSRELRQYLIDEGFDGRAIDVIHNGISVGPLPTADDRRAARARLGVSDEVTVVGTIARLDPVKDLGTLIRAIAHLRDAPPTLLVIVGDGAERAALEALAHEQGAADRIRFVGHQDQAREWLAGWDIYANSSISEGISLTILEAMAAGLPIVATRAGGTSEIVDGTCGTLVPSRDVPAIAAAIHELRADSTLRQARGSAARTRVMAEFTIERMTAEYAKAYSERFR
ncbi:MAG: glycosyltransferase [Vicinamibacterales bacterium]